MSHTRFKYISLFNLSQHDRWAADPYKGYPNDIALLRLTSPVDFSDERVGRACIPRENDYNFTDNENCWITGWGKLNCKEPLCEDLKSFMGAL